MRIAYDHQIFSLQRLGGISRYFVELASRLSEFPRAQVRIIAPVFINELLSRRGLHPFGAFLRWRIPHANRAILWLNTAVSPPLMRVMPADVVHETFYSRLRTSPRQTKIVLTVYDMVDEKYPEHHGSAYSGARQAKRAALSRADHVICISENTRRDLLERYPIHSAKTSVIHLGVSLPCVAKEKRVGRSPYLLYVGARWSYKNFGRLLQAFAVSGLYRSHELICFGGGPFTREETEQISRAGIPPEQVRFVADDDVALAQCYACADLLVYPSLYEGFGLPLLEAMQFRCPVVCSNTSSFPEIAGEAAEYFDPACVESIASTMIKVVQSKAVRDLLVERGSRRITQFSWDNCAEETYSVYKKVTGQV
jgi:glycosyltransferase involved in cell wall biosynthesis